MSESQYGVMGVSVDGQHLQCHVCHAWLKALCQHIGKAHGLSLVAYRTTFGLPPRHVSLHAPAKLKQQLAAHYRRKERRSAVILCQVDGTPFHPWPGEPGRFCSVRCRMQWFLTHMQEVKKGRRWRLRQAQKKRETIGTRRRVRGVLVPRQASAAEAETLACQAIEKGRLARRSASREMWQRPDYRRKMEAIRRTPSFRQKIAATSKGREIPRYRGRFTSEGRFAQILDIYRQFATGQSPQLSAEEHAHG